MSEDNQQAVVDETNGAAQPAPEGTNARDGDELDNILKEFEERPAASTTAQPEKPAASPQNEVQNASAEVLAARDEIRSERFNRDMNVTIGKVRGDLPSDLYDDDIVRSWINAQADKDPRLAQAWANRDKNPQKFEQVVNALGRDFAKRYGKVPDKGATEDREAVTAAVRGASTSAPPAKAPNYATMTPGEFQAEKDRMFGR